MRTSISDAIVLVRLLLCSAALMQLGRVDADRSGP